MIDLHNTLPFLVFFGSLVPKSQPQEKWKPTSRDAKEMREGMKAFTTTKINGRNWYPFEQYCASKGLIKAGTHGEFTVLNPFSWMRALDTKELMDWQDRQDLESTFQSFPEEREIHEAKIEAIKVDIRALFADTKVAMSL